MLLPQAEMSCTPAVVSQTEHIASELLVSDKDFYIFQWVVLTVLCQVIDAFGISTNIINIVCFTRQGLKDPLNVSLFGLAISDLCSLVTLLWSNICLIPVVSSADLPFDPIETQYIISGIPHTVFTRISGWITAVITFERCLCITMPLKVKEIITVRRVSVIIIGVYVVHIFSVVPVYIVNKLEMKWMPQKNTTLLGLVFTENRQDVEIVSFVVNNFFTSFSAFFVIIICTIVLVVKLRDKTKWRKKSTATGLVDNVSIRNKKVAKMVITLSVLFIVCFIPINISFLAMALVPGLSIVGQYKNVLIMSATIGVVLESINSSVNIFVYYFMSSNYREMLMKLFSMKKK